MDQASAARLVAALDLELGRRQAKRDAAEEQRWAQEHGDDPLAIFALKVDRLARRLEEPSAGLPPANWMSEHEQIVYRRSLEELADGVSALADRLRSRLDHEDEVAAGAPRRWAVVIGPRIRMAYGESRPASAKAKTVDGNGKSKKLSRTEIWAEKQTEEAMARQALLPPRLAQAALQQTELGWHLGEIISFDQIRKTGTVKFVGMVGISEAEISPDVAIRSGHANFFRGERVDCRLVRRLDGSVGIEAIRGSAAAEAAAEAEQRIRIQLDRKWMH